MWLVPRKRLRRNRPADRAADPAAADLQERAAQIALGQLLEQAAIGRQPETTATVAGLLHRYVRVADWELSTREANEGYIRRTIKPAVGHLPIRKVRGPVLDLLYARLRRCSDVSCTGKPFTEHCLTPVLVADPADSRPAWEQAAGRLRDAIGSGALTPGDPLPSVRELCALQGCDVDLDKGILHIAFSYVVAGGRRVRKDTKTHQDRHLAIDPVTCEMISEHLRASRAQLAAVGLELPKDAYVFSNDPMGARPWNPSGRRTKPANWRPRPASSSTSKG